MKDYPSIPREFREINGAYVFDKIDGSNIRAEWSRKRGWYKYGTRTRLLDPNEPVLGKAVELFGRDLSEPLSKLAHDERWESLIVFFEFWGPDSFAGVHQENDEHQVTLFDIAPYKKGILGPHEFLYHCKNMKIAKLIGVYNWTRGFVQSVLEGVVPGITFEGVVGKSGSGHKVVRAKAKTQAWIDKVRSLYAGKDADVILNS